MLSKKRLRDEVENSSRLKDLLFHNFDQFFLLHNQGKYLNDNEQRKYHLSNKEVVIGIRSVLVL
jgi:hypothetical protein